VDHPLMRIRMDLGPDAVAGPRLTATISPDGARIAYITRTSEGRQQLTTRFFDQASGVVLAGTDGAEEPFFFARFAVDRLPPGLSIDEGSRQGRCAHPNRRLPRYHSRRRPG
jgi:hypothetical protein